ncbi:bacteriophage head-tail adaptor [Clostridium sp. CAG:768]|nr:bacteriophage head-tail adaptor [Clostridium sp. CAG:768]
MVDCGKYNKLITVLELDKEGEENEIGEITHNYKPIKSFFARIESRVGSLLTGRQAGTIVSKTTHKISYPYLNFPKISAQDHKIECNGKKYSIDYVLDDDELDEEMQIFVTCED